MSEPSFPIEFEDVPLDQARWLGRGARLEPLFSDTLRQKIQALGTEATRVHLAPGIRPERMRRAILRVAHELGVPVTVRRVAGGVIFWRSTAEERQQAQELASRLLRARQQRKARPRRRRRT
jgi:hypothetical protein